MLGKSSMCMVAALALGTVTAPVSFAQDRPSWRPEAPERPEAPPEVTQPEFKFEVDRESLMSNSAQFQPEARTQVTARTAGPELGRVATWRERITGTDGRRSSGASRATRVDEPPKPENASPEPQTVASVTPPPDPVSKPTPASAPTTPVAPAGFRLTPSQPVQPNYPRQAYLDGTEGWVDVEILVAPDGSVVKAQVIDAEPRRVFEKAALRAADQWRFEPPQVSGVEAPQRGVYRFEFRMEG